LARVYIITPLEDQQNLARKIINHWVGGKGGLFNPDRKKALMTINVAEDLDQVVNNIEQREGVRPRVIITGAHFKDDAISYAEARTIIRSHHPTLFLFGTAWGLADEAMRWADYSLRAIEGRADYNHLSVRSAAAIIFDRLLS